MLGTFAQKEVDYYLLKYKYFKKIFNEVVLCRNARNIYFIQLYTWALPDGQYRNQIILFAAKDGEAVYSHQKQDLELTMAQIITSLRQNAALIGESRENHKFIQIWSKSNSY